MTPKFRTRSVALLVALLAACEGVSESEQIHGDYSATTLTVAQGGSTINALQLGVKLDVTLNQDGTTTGRLFVPDPSEPMDVSLAGRWTLRGDTVRFEHGADTFVRDIPFLVRDDRLEADHTIATGERFRVTLTKD